MKRPDSNSEAWKKKVLRSMSVPAWLGPDAPDGDIVVSSRARYARNVRGVRFPHHADADELRRVAKQVEAALAPKGFKAHTRPTEAERDYLLGVRLISPDFLHREPGRTLLLDDQRAVGVMTNEEDHVRLQALTAGNSAKTALVAADDALATLSAQVEWMHDSGWGYLTASPSNVGGGRRLSVLFHLIGLARGKRMVPVIEALAEMGLVVRGLFGEASRAVGAFFQVSATRADMADFMGAVDYLITQERMARREVRRSELVERVDQAREFCASATSVPLGDALRILAWIRWGASAGLDQAPPHPRDVDLWVSTMEVLGTTDQATADRRRADFLRQRVGIA